MTEIDAIKRPFDRFTPTESDFPEPYDAECVRFLSGPSPTETFGRLLLIFLFYSLIGVAVAATGLFLA